MIPDYTKSLHLLSGLRFTVGEIYDIMYLDPRERRYLPSKNTKISALTIVWKDPFIKRKRRKRTEV